MSFTEVSIPAPWGAIQGKWWGSFDKQPILFLHGWQDNSGSFDPLIEQLPKDLSYLCIDFPGHGFSSHYPKGHFYYIFYDGLITARRVVKHYGWQKVSIVGHSLGGAVGFMYAASYPDEIDKLVSLDIVCPRVSQPSTLANAFGSCIDNFLKYEGLPPDKQPCYEYDEMVAIALQGYKGSVTKDSVEILMKRGMKPCKEKEGKYLFSRDVRLKVSGLGMPSLDIVLELAAKVKCHYLNIRAKDGLKLESPEIYPQVLKLLRDTCKSFNYYVVDGAHHVHLNDAKRIAPFLAKFLTTEVPISESFQID